MSAKISHISSQSHLNRLLSTNAYVTLDFHAEWCGPCKMIGPIFDSLALAHSRPGKLAFAKIDVDANQDIAKRYNVSAMPTFLVLKGEDTVNSLRGADPSALRRMINDAAALAEKSVSPSFASTGHVLGSGDGDSGKSKASTSSTTTVRKPATTTASKSSRIFPAHIRGGDSWYTMIIRFFMLYFTTLFSLDPVAAGEASPYRRSS